MDGVEQIVKRDGYLSDLNEHTETIYADAVADHYLVDTARSINNYQFERIGFFALDPDSKLNAKKVSVDILHW